MALAILLLIGSASVVLGQRPFFAGSKPIGYPEYITTTTEGLGDRFGEVDGTTTTQRLPIEANGDKDLIDRLSKLPIDKQPFWFINWQALEAHRQNPQSYPQKPNVFIDNVPLPNPNVAPEIDTRFNTVVPSTPVNVPNTNIHNSVSGTANRFGGQANSPVDNNSQRNDLLHAYILSLYPQRHNNHNVNVENRGGPVVNTHVNTESQFYRW